MVAIPTPASLPAATLLMEAFTAPHVRGAGMGAAPLWSRLYEAGGLMLDVELAPRGRQLELRGQVLRRSSTPDRSAAFGWEGEVVLHGSDGCSSDPVRFDAEGDFVLPIGDPGCYVLELRFGDEALRLEALDIP